MARKTKPHGAQRRLLSTLVLLSSLLIVFGASAASITTDQSDYAPGATATFTGAGFQPGETVEVQVVHVDGTSNDDPSHQPWYVSADDNGGFVTTWIVDTFDAIGSTLEVEATGLTSSQYAAAQFTDSVSVDFTQAANKDSGFALGNVHWITVNLQANNCYYYEGMSTLQRIMMTSITANSSNTHTLAFSHQASQGGANHAYDFLTSWSQAVAAANAIYGGPGLLTNLNECGTGISSAATCNSIISSGNSKVVTAPSNLGTVLGDNITNSINGYESQFGTRSITIYGNAPITSATLTFTGYTGSTDLTANYSLTWVSSSTSVIIEAAAHLAVSVDTLNAGIGYGTSKGAWVPNPPVYHFTIASIDGASISGMDNKIKASDIVQPPPPCGASNNSPLCVGSTLQLGAATATGMTYSWTGPNGFTSTSQNPTIANVTAANAGSYTLTTVSGTGTNTCTTVVTVNQLPNCSISGSTTVCPFSTNTYSAAAGMSSYSWSATGATIIGASTNQTVSIAAGSCASSYTVSLTVVSNGCSSSCSQSVNATDTTAPVISSLPAVSTIFCPNTPSFTTPTATDGCDSAPTLTFNDATAPGSCAQSYTVTRTWTATDRCGNSTTASQTITVRDTAAPVLSGIPAASTIQCPATPSFTTPTVTDACDNSPNLTFVNVTNAGACAQAYTIVRTWTATDHCGNSSTASQSITVQDTTAPVLSGIPVASTIQCSSTPSFTTPTVADACDNSPTLTFVNVTNVGACAQAYTVVRIWTATDHCGNSSSASQTITVQDTTAPVLSSVPANVTVQCDAVPSAGSPLATDACDNSPTITFSESSTQAGSGCGKFNYTITRTWTATDHCGNSSSASQIVTVHDTTAPVLSAAPSDLTVQCDAIPSAATLTASDNCDASPVVTFSQTTTNNGSGSGLITRTWTATDACGNTSTRSQQITFIDTTAPVLSAIPANTTVQCDAIPTAPTLTATDNCDTNPVVTLAQTTTQTASGCGHFGYTITRTWTATDFAGNTSTGAQSITVIDTTAPTLSGVPADGTVECSSVPVAATPVATDNCDTNATVTLAEASTQTPSGCGHANYVITRTWTASDACGNTSTAQQTLTVHDTTAPVLSGVPANTTVECSSVPTATTPTATDNCDTTPVVTLNEVSTQTASGCTHANYSITRTWTATDACGNSSTGQQIITVRDTTAPLISSLPAASTIECPASPPFTTPTATDSCDVSPALTFNDVTIMTACPQAYTITRTWTATDACGNTSTAAQSITVNSTTAPVISSLPAPSTIQCPTAPSFTTPTVTHACDPSPLLSFNDVTNAGPCPQTFTITRTWTASDHCGNSSTATQSITIQDTTAPVISALPSASTIQCPATPTFTTPTANDACDGSPTLAFNDITTPSACAQAYNVTRRWTATDHCGNTSTASQSITVIDTTAPVISSLPAPSTIQCPASPTFTTPIATDGCDNSPTLAFSDVTSAGSCPQEQIVTRTWTATDHCGNTSTASQVITVRDTTAPVISSLPAPSTIQCPTSPSFATPTPTDACDGSPLLSFADVTAAGSCPQEHIVTRTWTATDHCGNASTASQVITVRDTTAPVISSLPAPSTIECTSSPSFTTPTATDACDGSPLLNFADVTTTGSGSQFTITRTWTATDHCGNSSTSSQSITIHDTTAPILSSVPSDTTAHCDAVPSPASPTASDSCDPTPTISLAETSTQTANGCSHTSYTITRTWTATDAGGNSSSASQTITVIPVAPVFTSFPADTTVDCAGNIPSCGSALATNTCGGIVIVTCSDATNSQTCANRFTVVRTYTASDICGNTTSSNQIITVNDTIAPAITTFPADVTVSCASLVPVANTALVSATDNCSGTPTITVANETISAQTCADRYTITRTYEATDACGNTATRNQIITVDDHTAPVLSNVPADTTVSCSLIPVATTPTATDNCGGTANIVLTQQSTQTGNGNGHANYVITRTWTATDACGNASSATQTLTVVDDLVPVLSGVPANTTVECNTIPSASTPTVSDSCGGVSVISLAETSTQAANGCGHYNYTLTRTWTATATGGNTSSASQVITVQDTTAPVITAFPADATLTCMCNLPAANNALVTASDNCSTVTIAHTANVTNNVIDQFQFDIQRTYTATDACGNQSSQTQTFHLNLPNTLPTIAITGAPTFVVNKATFTLHGTAASPFGVGAVHYSLNGAPTLFAAGTANWSANLQLIPGTNTLIAYSVDVNSILSTNAIATIFYAVSNRLTVQIREWPKPNQLNPAAGSITPNLANQKLQVGNPYTITAIPAGLHRFKGWALSPSANAPMVETNNTFTFIMQNNLTVVARFENPFYNLKNIWSGLFSEATPDPISAGFMTFNLTPYDGSYSGSIWLDGTQYHFGYPDALFDINGHSHLIVQRPGKAALTIDMDMDVTNYSGTITGTVQAGPQPLHGRRDLASGWTANLLMHRAWTNVANAEFRRYTMAFPPVNGPTPSPTGWGVAATTNNVGGAVHFIGYTADGSRINTPVTYVSENLEYPMYGQLYQSPTGYLGSMWGWLTFSTNQPGVTGTVYWWRPPGITNSGYTAGFSNAFQVIGSPYTNYPMTTPELGWTGPSVAYFTAPDLLLTSPATVAPNDRVTFTRPNTNLVGMSVTRLNGLINGTLLQDLIQKKDPPFRGVILQNSNIALGNYYACTNAGGFIFQPQ